VAGPEGVTRVYFENYTSPFAYLDQVKLEISNLVDWESSLNEAPGLHVCSAS
jgi:hypothetical protein